MLRYLLIRILWLIPIILCVSLIIFALMDLAPGDIVDTMNLENMTQEEIDALRAQYGLDKPMIYRFGVYMLGLIQGDLGTSQVSGLPIWETFISRFPRTLEIALLGLVLGVVIAIPLGILAAKYAGTIWDNIITVFAMVGLSMPGFWLGLLLMVWFTVKLKLLPAGYDGTLKSYIMPAVTTGLIMAATTIRQTRAAMLEASRADYLRTARSKGVSEFRVTTRHALRNAWIPVITQIGMILSRMLAGSAVIETVFSWPGVGRLTVDAVSNRDTTLATGCVILTAIVYVLMLLIVDIMYALVDPRIKAQYAPARKKNVSIRKKAGRVAV